MSPTDGGRPQIRVLLADDHPLWRRGVQSLLDAELDITVVAEASDGAEALRLLRSIPVDVALLDVEMPFATGVDVARAVEAEGLDTRVLALSSHDAADYVGGLLMSGASGYLTKDKAPELVVEAVRAVARGEGRWFVRPAASHDAVSASLSAREREVLSRLARGLTNKEIGEDLFIAENTVRNHLVSVYEKTSTANARAAMVWAWKNGLGVG